jgi:hypothetical protein
VAFSFVGNYDEAPPFWSLYIVGKGCTLPLPQGTRAAANGGRLGQWRPGLGPAGPP